MLAYILPAACYLKLASGEWWERKKIGKVLCIGFGGIVMVLGTVLTLAGRKSGGGKTC